MLSWTVEISIAHIKKKKKRVGYLNDGNVKESTAHTDCNGSRSHDGRASEEPDSH